MDLYTSKNTLSVRDYLQGKVRGFTLSDETLRSICADAGIDNPEDFITDVGARELELGVAWLYTWLATGPSSSSRHTEQDGDWSHTEGGETFSATQVRTYIRLADAIFKKYGLQTIGQNTWGFRCGGFRNIRATKLRRY